MNRLRLSFGLREAIVLAIIAIALAVAAAIAKS